MWTLSIAGRTVPGEANLFSSKETDPCRLSAREKCLLRTPLLRFAGACFLAAAIALSCVERVSAQNLVLNPSFEGPLAGTWAGSDWGRTSGVPNASDGTGYADIGSLGQDITGIVPNQTYQLMFDGGCDLRWFSTVPIFANFGGGEPVGFQTTPRSHTGGASDPDLKWETFTATFVASSESTRLDFWTVSPYRATLDNVRLVAVPEPRTWALMAMGVACLGWRLKGRSV